MAEMGSVYHRLRDNVIQKCLSSPAAALCPNAGVMFLQPHIKAHSAGAAVLGLGFFFMDVI